MRLKNGEVCFRWPLAQHIITAGWLYNDGSLHRALDFRAAVAEHRSMYSYVRLSIDRCTATYV